MNGKPDLMCGQELVEMLIDFIDILESSCDHYASIPTDEQDKVRDWMFLRQEGIGKETMLEIEQWWRDSR